MTTEISNQQAVVKPRKPNVLIVLFLIAVPLFLIAYTMNCSLSQTAWDIQPKIFAAIFLLVSIYISLAFLKIQHASTKISSSYQLFKNIFMIIIASFILSSLLLGLELLILNSSVRWTANTQIEFKTPIIERTQYRKKCPVFIGFYNYPIGTNVVSCAETSMPEDKVKIGDFVDVKEKVGRFGVWIESVQVISKPNLPT